MTSFKVSRSIITVAARTIPGTVSGPYQIEGIDVTTPQELEESFFFTLPINVEKGFLIMKATLNGDPSLAENPFSCVLTVSDSEGRSLDIDYTWIKNNPFHIEWELLEALKGPIQVQLEVQAKEDAQGLSLSNIQLLSRSENVFIPAETETREFSLDTPVTPETTVQDVREALAEEWVQVADPSWAYADEGIVIENLWAFHNDRTMQLREDLKTLMSEVCKTVIFKAKPYVSATKQGELVEIKADAEVRANCAKFHPGIMIGQAIGKASIYKLPFEGQKYKFTAFQILNMAYYTRILNLKVENVLHKFDMKITPDSQTADLAYEELAENFTSYVAAITSRLTKEIPAKKPKK